MKKAILTLFHLQNKSERLSTEIISRQPFYFNFTQAIKSAKEKKYEWCQSVFYKEFYSLFDTYSLEAPEPQEYLKQLFSSDLEKLMKSYSEILYFKQVIEDLTGNEFEI